MISVREAIDLLRDHISGADEDLIRDSRINDVIRLLEHLDTKAFVQEYLRTRGLPDFSD